MATKVKHLTDDEASLLDSATVLAKAQLRHAISIVGEVTGRNENDADSALVGAVMQALATNQLALAMSR